MVMWVNIINVIWFSNDLPTECIVLRKIAEDTQPAHSVMGKLFFPLITKGGLQFLSMLTFKAKKGIALN